MGQNISWGFLGLVSQQHKARAVSFSVNVSPLITFQSISYFQPNISVVITGLHNIHLQGKQMPPTKWFVCSHVVLFGWLSACTQFLTDVCVPLPTTKCLPVNPVVGTYLQSSQSIPASCLAGKPKKSKQEMW